MPTAGKLLPNLGDRAFFTYIESVVASNCIVCIPSWGDWKQGWDHVLEKVNIACYRNESKTKLQPGGLVTCVYRHAGEGEHRL